MHTFPHADIERETYRWMDRRTDGWMHVQTDLLACTLTRVYMYICKYMCVNIMHACMHTYIHTYIHAHMLTKHTLEVACQQGFP